MRFSSAIVRVPGSNFADGLTTVDLGLPDYQRVLRQHQHYCQTLEKCGLKLTRLPADVNHPDATFVEDTAIITRRGAILTRPGAASRIGEVTSISTALTEFFPSLERITAPGTVDGGDICEADDHFFIGISERTNQAGAEQLAEWLAKQHYTSSFVDIRGLSSILHLKSGIAYLGERRLVAIAALANQPAYQNYQIIPIDPAEEYAANCLPINDYLLMAAGYPSLQDRLSQLGYQIITLEMSEFQKMDGGLSCLSLRLP